MTNPDKTLIVALLDRSGSMHTAKQATEEGWREFINGQKQLPGECRVTLAQFDDVYELVYQNVDINDVPEFVLLPRNMTALLDATGKLITEIGIELDKLPEDERPGKVICMIMTDGFENASHEWTWETVKKLIEQQRNDYGWEFMFLGANIDAVKVGGQLGVPASSSITYDSHNAAATRAVYGAAGVYTSSVRGPQVVQAAFSDEDRDEAMGKTKK